MPNYEYCCIKCDYVFDVYHSYKETPKILCPKCNGDSHKQISSFYLGTQSLTKNEMEQDLRENYGIHKTQMREGSFRSFYEGVKKDGDRVKEQMKKGEEEQEKKIAKKNLEFNKKVFDDSKVFFLKEQKAKKDYNKRKIALQ